MKVACIGYRDWALRIYDFLEERTEHDFMIIASKREYCETKIREFNPDIILFYGWSWIIGGKIIDDYKCIMLHPSPMPKYRGGSPIQNQIINGEKQSAVTLFLMDSGVDTGDIIAQESMSLDGRLSDVLERIYKLGCKLTLKILNDGYTTIKQDDSKSTHYKRRKKSDSEITLDEIKEKSADYLYNKIRMLEDPYPNAFIRTKDGKKLLIKWAELGE